MDPDAVPGVLIANRKSHIPDPRLKDLTASVLERELAKFESAGSKDALLEKLKGLGYLE